MTAPLTPAPESEKLGPQTNVRLSDAAREHLATLKRYYGLKSTTALLTFLLGDSVRRLLPPKPLTLPSPETIEEEHAHVLYFRLRDE